MASPQGVSALLPNCGEPQGMVRKLGGDPDPSLPLATRLHFLCTLQGTSFIWVSMKGLLTESTLPGSWFIWGFLVYPAQFNHLSASWTYPSHQGDPSTLHSTPSHPSSSPTGGSHQSHAVPVRGWWPLEPCLQAWPAGAASCSRGSSSLFLGAEGRDELALHGALLRTCGV